MSIHLCTEIYSPNKTQTKFSTSKTQENMMKTTDLSGQGSWYMSSWKYWLCHRKQRRTLYTVWCLSSLWASRICMCSTTHARKHTHAFTHTHTHTYTHTRCWYFISGQSVWLQNKVQFASIHKLTHTSIHKHTNSHTHT